MITRISGKIKAKNEQNMLLEVGGITYEVMIPPAVMSNIDREYIDGQDIALVTYHYHQQEPSKSIPMLVGFVNEVEKEFFERFITVSGVGPKAACRALSLPFSTIADAIANGDIKLLKSLPGIGEQKAREIIAKLQNKIGKFGLIQDRALKPVPRVEPSIKDEAFAVLLQLQYKKKEAEDMISKAVERNPDVKTSEELLNEVYRGKWQKKN